MSPPSRLRRSPRRGTFLLRPAKARRAVRRRPAAIFALVAALVALVFVWASSLSGEWRFEAPSLPEAPDFVSHWDEFWSEFLDDDESYESPDFESTPEGALEATENYLSYYHPSYDGLVEFLMEDGYSEEDATYAADNCGADWSEQALLSAMDYLELGGFSYTGLIDQLEFDGFTAEQAAYAADNCEADWDEQAVLCVERYLDYDPDMSDDELRDQLEYEGFTQEQTERALEGVDR